MRDSDHLKKIYFVAETKGEGQELRLSEKMKIDCVKSILDSLKM